MDINRTTLDALFKAVVRGFQAGMDQKPAFDYTGMTTPFTSTTAANYYPFLHAIPGFIEWIGARQFENLRGQKLEVQNRDFELSLTMPKKDLDDDTYGVYVGLTQMVAAGWPVLLSELVVEVLTSQTGRTGWDGYTLISDSHKYGANSIDNKVTDALSETSVEAGLLAASEWKFANGKHIKPHFTHLLYGPKNHEVAFDLLKNQFRYDSTDKVQIANRNYGRLIPVEMDDFVGTYDDYWLMLDLSQSIKPVLVQTRKTPVVTMTMDPEKIAETGEVHILADGRAAAAPTFFHLAYGGIL